MAARLLGSTTENARDSQKKASAKYQTAVGIGGDESGDLENANSKSRDTQLGTSKINSENYNFTDYGDRNSYQVNDAFDIDAPSNHTFTSVTAVARDTLGS